VQTGAVSWLRAAAGCNAAAAGHCAPVSPHGTGERRRQRYACLLCHLCHGCSCAPAAFAWDRAALKAALLARTSILLDDGG